MRLPLVTTPILCAAFVGCAFLGASLTAEAQVIYSTAGSVYSQNFDGMSVAGTTVTLPTGWTVGTNSSGPGGTTSNLNLFNTTTSTLNSTTVGSSYVFETTDGSTPSGDLSLGSISGSGPYLTQLRITNSTGATLTSFTLSYLGEQWRQVAAPETLTFYYGIGTQVQANMTAAGSTFNFTTPQSGTTASLNGDLAANQVANIGGTVSGITWAPGTILYLRWSDPGTGGGAGNSSAVAIDNFTFTAVPEPQAVALLGIAALILGYFARRSRTARA